MKYVLADTDIETIARAIALRILESSRQGLNHATTYQRDMPTRVKEEFVGASAELAWAHLHGKVWHNPINEFHDIPDTGRYEIRATHHQRGGLIIRDNDPSERIYVLATVDKRAITFRGWAYGRDAKKPEHLFNPHGYRQAWKLTQNQLRPLNELHAS